MTNTPKKRKPYKKSRRAKTSRKNPAVSARFKELWQDPEFRERMKKRDENRSRMMKEEPHRFFRRGVPNGMRKHKAVKLWAKAHKLADRFIQIMKDKGELPDEKVEVMDENGSVELVNVPATDTGKAEAALKEAFVLAVGPSTQQIKIQAINTVLNFTKAKPESKSKLTLNKAEDFLDEIMKDDGAN